jgi:hypothetical protein
MIKINRTNNLKHISINKSKHHLNNKKIKIKIKKNQKNQADLHHLHHLKETDKRKINLLLKIINQVIIIIRTRIILIIQLLVIKIKPGEVDPDLIQRKKLNNNLINSINLKILLIKIKKNKKALLQTLVPHPLLVILQHLALLRVLVQNLIQNDIFNFIY